MRARRLVVVLGVFASATLAIGPGCRDATQATLEIRLMKSDLCPTLGGTALAVGAERGEVETRINTYVTAETRECNVATGSIGSLVVTPGEGGRSAVVVVVAFDTNRARTATDCKPPAYAGCVVARRFFAFSDHKNLRIPISIDPECLDVPCNATSTCRKGNCYDSTTDDGIEPGDDGKGGTTEAGIVDGAVDGFTPDGSQPDGSTSNDGGDGGGGGDGGKEGGEAGTGPIAICDDGGTLQCNEGGALTACGVGSGKDCCDLDVPNKCVAKGACGTKDRYCCIHNDCPGQECVGRSGTSPGRCKPQGFAVPQCPAGAPPLMCNGTACSGANNACCSAQGSAATCTSGSDVCTTPDTEQWCCDNADCGGGAKLCPPSLGGDDARICGGGKVVF